MRITVRVPATSANLGPGFDCFGLALDLCNEVTIDTDAEPGVTWEGEGADELPADGTDMVSSTIATRVRRERHPRRRRSRCTASTGSRWSAGSAPRRRPPWPAWWLAPPTPVGGDLRVAASPSGSWRSPPRSRGIRTMPRRPRSAGSRSRPPTGSCAGSTPIRTLRPVALVPSASGCRPGEARAALPPTVSPRGRGVQRRACRRDGGGADAGPALLRVALQDRLHQDARLALVPAVRDVFDELRAGDIPVCVSGAGPSLLAFEIGGSSGARSRRGVDGAPAGCPCLRVRGVVEA